MKKFLLTKRQGGFSLVEVVVACAIISLAVLTVMNVAKKGIELSHRTLREAQAINLLEEGVEAVKSIRDTNWETITNLSLGVDYYLYFNTISNTWTINETDIVPMGSIPSNPIDEVFERTVNFSQVERDSNDDIASSGTIDNNSKEVTVSVSWFENGQEITKNISFYLINIFE